MCLFGHCKLVPYPQKILKQFYDLIVVPGYNDSIRISMYDGERAFPSLSNYQTFLTVNYEDGSDWDMDDVVLWANYAEYIDSELGSVLSIILKECNTENEDKIIIRLRKDFKTEYELLESGQVITDLDTYFTLWPKCQGHLGEVKNIAIRIANSNTKAVQRSNEMFISNETGSCIDTDGGNNTMLKGKVMVYANFTYYSYFDSCYMSDSVNEFICNGTKSKIIPQKCPKDRPLCSGGACVKSQIS